MGKWSIKMETYRLLKRRDFLKNTVKTSAAAAFAAITAPSILKAETADSPPNVVFIICDQMRGDALSCLGHPNARTPNLDKLAAGGALCENYFRIILFASRQGSLYSAGCIRISMANLQIKAEKR